MSLGETASVTQRKPFRLGRYYMTGRSWPFIRCRATRASTFSMALLWLTTYLAMQVKQKAATDLSNLSMCHAKKYLHTVSIFYHIRDVQSTILKNLLLCKSKRRRVTDLHHTHATGAHARKFMTNTKSAHNITKAIYVLV